MTKANALFIDLQDLTPSDPLTEGKPFDGLVAGTFTDMRNRKIEITDEDLGELVANTQRAIEATRSESGELVGLPIDAKGHEAGDGAGWIVGIELSDGILRLTPKWTKIGLELIEEGIRRFFSATLDTLRNVVMGGTLTNWPATRDNKTGEVLLRPIELAHLQQPLYSAEFQEESLDDKLDQVRQAWWAIEPATDGPTSWVLEVFEDHVIIDRAEGGFVKVPYSLDDEGEILFADEGEWKVVRKSWVEMIRQAISSTLSLALRDKPTEEAPIGDPEGNHDHRKPDAGRSSGTTEEETMGDKVAIADLSAEDQQIIIGGVVTELGLDPAAFKENGDLGESMAQLVDAAAEVKAKASLDAATRTSEIAELAKDLTGGTDEHAVGIPVEADALTEFLASLDDDQREMAEKILSAIQEKGLTEFEEDGHSRKVKGSAKLEDEYAAQLTTYLAENEKATVAEFFKLNEAELGVMSDYDLSEFVKEENDG